MDTSDPDITFGDGGWCNYCRAYDENEETRKREKGSLPWVLHEMRTHGCVIGLSGGVDSSLVLHYLIENDVRPKVAFSVDNSWNTKASDENIMRLVEGLKVPFERVVLDKEAFRSVQLAFINSGTANVEIPTDHVLMAVSYQKAREHGVKYIASGGNLATENTMPPAWGYNARDYRFIKSVCSTFLKPKALHGLKRIPTMTLFRYLWERFVRGTTIVELLDYYEYDREKAKKLLAEKYGWKDYGEKHDESMFTTWAQNYWQPMKFGFVKRRAHLSALIHSRQLSRDDALKLMDEPYKVPSITFDRDIMKIPTRSYRDFKNSEATWDGLSKLYGHLKRAK